MEICLCVCARTQTYIYIYTYDLYFPNIRCENSIFFLYINGGLHF